MEFTIAHDHPCLPGHFPGRPLVPGVVILERVVEAAEAAGAAPGTCWQWPQVKFLQPLLPGQTARIELDRDGRRWRFRVLHDGTPLASGELKAGGT
ncbi:hypothetical protein [Marilutibacter alkalisoli]|uniref:ApeI dehydratase-like domain-containing protein n=1 Tax=Marilutibacter alkalisoli TaxID=2591633 RepID=A0A514BN38_9GAMM|nr:hypothetical protein [Lysobacter alkalisoli]QDH68808.1 hypothetical protein FKV23_00785 [Lysobacter alkalisoli]